MDDLLTVFEVAVFLKTKARAVRRWIRLGELKAFRLGKGGRQWRVRRQELQEFIRSQQARPQA